MILVTLMVLSCQNVNSADWCAEPQKELYVTRAMVQSLEQAEYRPVKSLSDKDLIPAVMGKWPEPKPACKVKTKDTHFFTKESCAKVRSKVEKAAK